MIAFGQSCEIKLLRELSSLPHAEDLFTLLQELRVVLLRVFSARCELWWWHVETQSITPDDGIEGQSFPISVHALKARFDRAQHSWVIDESGRWLLLCAELNTERRLLICVSPCNSKLSTEYLETLCAQISLVVQAALRSEQSLKQNQLLRLVNLATSVALEGDCLDDVADRIVGFLRDRFSCQLVSLHLLDDTGENLHVMACRADARSEPLPIGSRTHVKQGVVGRACRLAEPQLVNDVGADPDYLVFDSNVKCEFALPVIRRGMALGVLNLESSRAGVFDGDTQISLRAIASQLAGSLYMASINQQLNRQHIDIVARESDLARANQKLLRANDNLKRLSMIDGLTGIGNRRALSSNLRRVWRELRGTERPISVVMCDLDYFKQYNDTLGHLAGDDALKNVVRALQKAIRKQEGILARYGGEEFALLLPDVDREVARTIAERQRESVLKLGLSAGNVALTISCGVATLTSKRDRKPDSLIAQADLALYQAKRLGRNQVVEMGAQLDQ